jgi:hypothetical protein
MARPRRHETGCPRRVVVQRALRGSKKSARERLREEAQKAATKVSCVAGSDLCPPGNVKKRDLFSVACTGDKRPNGYMSHLALRATLYPGMLHGCTCARCREDIGRSRRREPRGLRRFRSVSPHPRFARPLLHRDVRMSRAHGCARAAPTGRGEGQETPRAKVLGVFLLSHPSARSDHTSCNPAPPPAQPRGLPA